MTCPNCNAPEDQQIQCRMPNARYCRTCMCIWVYPEHRLLLTAAQIEKIEQAEDDSFSYSPKKG